MPATLYKIAICGRDLSQWSITDVYKDVPIGTCRSREEEGKTALKSNE